MLTNNTSLLTRSHAVYAAKKRAKRTQVKEVVFDEDARREYLTGFRKRNLMKKEARRKHAHERERVEKLELRKQHRQELAERAAKNVREVEGAFGVLPEDSMLNLERTHNEKIQEEELEFEDEEQLAVVTVVEDFSADSLRHPNPPLSLVNGSSPPEGEEPGTSRSIGQSIREKEAFKAKSKLKAKSNKVRYETKAARKVERTKQKARRTEKAERAGGKQKRRAKR